MTEEVSKRKFGGKMYRFVGTIASKADAVKAVKFYRSLPDNFARMVKSTKGYEIWIR